MTEEIIIDGINVAGCKFVESNIQTTLCRIGAITQRCKENNCYYKQLQRLKQENEDLKIYIESNKQQVEEVEVLVMDNNRLQQEVENLKDVIYYDVEKYRSALEEIKEIAEKYMFLKPDILTLKGDIGYIQNEVAVEILQLINKVEV